jgi:hypothetical protein
MLIFRSIHIENVHYAIENGIWQTNKWVPRKIKIGDKIAVQIVGTKFIIVLGTVASLPYNAKRVNWPTNENNEPLDTLKPTIDIKPISLLGPWRYINV